MPITGHLFIIASIIVCGAAVAEETQKTTKNIIQIDKLQPPDDAVHLLSETENQFVPVNKGKSLWVFKDGVLTASSKMDSVMTPKPYRDFQMHVEFNVNDAPDADHPEKNGNSGIYIQQRYELQILNSFGIPAEEYQSSYAGSLYKLKAPDQLVSKKAGEWQTYDIVFRAARFEGETKVENARITVYQNGVLIHDDYSISRKTGAGKKEGSEPLPIVLQGHENPVQFRNIWIKELVLE